MLNTILIMTEPTITLADYLEHVLEERGMSQRALADAADISPRTLGRILNGENVDHDILQKLADYLGLPVLRLYQMAGYIEEEPSSLPPEIEAMATRIAEIKDERRRRAVMRIIAAALETAIDEVENGEGTS